jgi:DNA-binding Xre family transcriptional regulator
MIAIKLREAMEDYKRRTGRRVTYQILSESTGISAATFHKIGSRDDYNATLATVEKICLALNTTPADLLQMIPDPPKPKKERKPASKRAG